jgi:hypothetical protein
MKGADFPYHQTQGRQSGTRSGSVYTAAPDCPDLGRTHPQAFLQLRGYSWFRQRSRLLPHRIPSNGSSFVEHRARTCLDTGEHYFGSVYMPGGCDDIVSPFNAHVELDPGAMFRMSR